tara:strand:+ start:817 stop:1023 length:207 start_codon:yes stop_codon:yes gene_type:complete
MQGNKLKEQALLKIQSKIWEQKRLIKELEDDIEKDNDIEFEIVELQFNNAINQLQIYEYIKKAIQNYD